MRLIAAFVAIVTLMSPISAALAQEAMMRAIAEAWKKRQAQQQRIDRNLNQLDKDAARGFIDGSFSGQTRQDTRGRKTR